MRFTAFDPQQVALTWGHVSEPNGGHGHETEVKGVEEGPVLKKNQILARQLNNTVDDRIKYCRNFNRISLILDNYLHLTLSLFIKLVIKKCLGQFENL